MRQIMLVDDEPQILSALQRELRAYTQSPACRYPLEVVTFDSPFAALRAQGRTCDIVISDYRMPEMDGVAFLEKMKAAQPDAIRIILSGATELDVLIEAINRVQIFRYIPKPWRSYDVISVIEQALAYHDLLLENQRLADMVRLQQGRLSKQEMELRRLEKESPGITKVNWGPEGEVLLDETDT